MGDLVKVRYATKNPYDDSIDGWGTPFVGVIVDIPYRTKYSVLKMWCFSTCTEHTLMPELDIVEVISESR